MSKRKKYIIDREFQLRTTFSIIGVVIIITAVIVGAISASVVYNNRKIENIYEIEDNIVNYLSSRPVGIEDQAVKTAMKDVTRNHNINMVTLKQMMFINRVLLFAIVLIVLFEGGYLYFMLIRKTHRISGPIYVMSNYMKDIIDGKTPRFRSLRQKDELKEFYDLFKATVKSLQDRGK